MKKTISFLLRVGIMTVLTAQSDKPCKDFACAFQKVEALVTQENYQKARTYLGIAETFLTSANPEEKKNVQQMWFKLGVLSRNTNFYDDKFGLEFDKYTRKNGFIDKNLNTKIDFKYDEATEFGYTTVYAKVKRAGMSFLIDTFGNEYKLATNINELNPSIVALDLSNQNLVSIPPSVFKQKQLKILVLKKNNSESSVIYRKYIF